MAEHKFNPFEEEEAIEVNIRPVRECDARALLALMELVGQETPYLVTGPKGLPYSVEEEKEILRSYEESQRSIMFIAEVDDQIVGTANLSAHSREREAHVAELGITIIKEYWAYGIGSIFMEELIDFATHSGIEVISLEVVTENERAIKLYEKFNFSTVGTLSKRLKVDCSYYDTHIMELLL